jgi:hypothetical protein
MDRQDRGMLVLAAGFAVIAALFVAYLFVEVVGTNPEDTGPYEPFRLTNAPELSAQIATEGPVCVADPTGGIRSFCVALFDDDFVAVHMFIPDEPLPQGVPLTEEQVEGVSGCVVSWNRRTNQFVDCNGDNIELVDLSRFPTYLAGNEPRDLFVDVRQVNPPISAEMQVSDADASSPATSMTSSVQ